MLRRAGWVCALLWVACSGTSQKDERAAADGDVPEDVDAGEVEQAGDSDTAPLASQDAGPDGICSVCGGCEETQSNLSAQHKPEPITYVDAPPTGGDHAGSCWGRFGVHEEAVPEARWVHNLEHGAVVFLHNCADGCAAERKRLEGLAKGRPFALVTPDARLPTRFAVVAWGVRLLADCVDDEAFVRFYDKHVDQAAESSTSGPPGGC